jgi:CubicO group peptidase (beta-lactamase class C family)
MKKQIFIFFVVICLVPQSYAQSDFRVKDGKNEIEEKLNQVKVEGLPGFAFAVIQGDQVIFEKYAGLADVREKKPIDQNSQFYIASIAKTFTAAAVLLLAEQKEIRLEDHINQYLDNLPDCTKDVRVFHLLAHTSGLPDYYDHLGEDLKDFYNEDVLRFVRQIDSLDFEPGVDYSYSNTAYVLLAEIIKKASGLPYSEFLEKNIFYPLGMNHTQVKDHPDILILNRTRGYDLDNETQSVSLNDYTDIYTVGGGGIYSSLNDLIKWYFSLRNHRLLSEKNTELMFYFPVTDSGRISYMTMGWFNETFGKKTPELEGLRAYGAIGMLKGFRAILKFFPDHDLAYITLSNCGELPLWAWDIGKAFFERK